MRFAVRVQLIMLISLLSSCSIGKRYHNGGFHFEWRSRGGVSQGEKSNSSNLLKGSNKKDINARISPNQDIDTCAGNMLMFAAVDKKESGSQPQKAEQGKQLRKELISGIADKIRYQPSRKSVQYNPPGANDNFSRLNAKTPDNHKNYLQASEGHNSGGGGMRTFGWILIILGALVVLFISIVLGVILILLGIIFALSGRNQEPGKGKNPDPETTEKTKANEELVDVLYLKNGSMIRGKILEFVSGGNVKIQTADGSIFVYKADEVDKIVKEPVKK